MKKTLTSRDMVERPPDAESILYIQRMDQFEELYYQNNTREIAEKTGWSTQEIQNYRTLFIANKPIRHAVREKLITLQEGLTLAEASIYHPALDSVILFNQLRLGIVSHKLMMLKARALIRHNQHLLKLWEKKCVFNSEQGGAE